MSLSELAATGGNARFDKVHAAYRQLDAENSAAFRLIVQDEEYTATQVANALRGEGFDINSSQIVYYRKKLREGKVQL